MLPPPPFGVCPAPISVALLGLTEQHAKAHAGFAIALVTELMQSDELCFSRGPVCRLSCDTHEAACQPEEYYDF